MSVESAGADSMASFAGAKLGGQRVWKDPAEKTFEDFSVGDVCITRGRTVDVGDLTAFAGLTGDHYPLHTDAEYAAATRFAVRIAHGPLTFAIAVGLVGMSGFYGDAIVALVEVKRLRATAPVHPGDTLRVHASVVACESDPERPRSGLLEVEYSVRNQRDEQVMVFQQVMLARRQAA
jgi:3-hydroxybutyryl-CoA dehydratase